jgi:acetate kinase
MRTLVDEANGGNRRALLAIDMFCYRIKKYIGAYYATLGHLDAIVFTGGIGENASLVREKICGGLEELGIKLDPQRNNHASNEVRRIETEGGRVAILVIPTDEEGVIAADTYQLATTLK